MAPPAEWRKKARGFPFPLPRPDKAAAGWFGAAKAPVRAAGSLLLRNIYLNRIKRVKQFFP